MDNEFIKGIVWPMNIESISPFRSNEKTSDMKQYRRCWGITCYPCSKLCIGLLILLALLILAIIATFLILFLGKNKEATTTPISTAINLTTKITSTTTTTVLTKTIPTKSTTITTTSTIASTTTTMITCGTSCLNQSWIDSSGGLAFWPFDGSYIDIVSGYNGIPSPNPPTFVTGYLGEAASFDASTEQSMYTSFISLNNVSFTVEAWIKPTGYPNPRDHSIVGLCPSKITSRCLHINIRNRKLYFGFYYDDLQGVTTILLNEWIHVVFTFDLTTKIQTIYLNGFPNAQRIAANSLQVDSGNFTIGVNEGVDFPYSYFQGYIDQLSISRRTKSSCEILEIATLSGHFKFDTPSPFIDLGPNSVATTSSSTSIITGHKNQAISFSGSSTSYFQTWGFTSFGISNKEFSLAFWIQPQILSGTIVHLSTSSLGTGSQCFSLLGFDSNGAIIAQVLTDNNNVVTATGPILPVSSLWIAVVQTWSSTNGLRLYVNNTLVSSVEASTFLGSETTPNYLTLGNCLNGCDGTCSSGSIGTPGPFTGAIDDWRIYNRELTSDDVCALHFAI
ncbi:unnamed protein product [Rotaria sordida]|uniref:Uncharacterized protein n=1 Tax=Rotaria sordida TaxID=392033 RepID=A0A815EMD7_9BILA|nr:unnamed protein product [Rotaria sordida]